MIGAGASLAEAAYHKPVRDREHPPLDATFFQRVKKYRPSPLLERIERQARALGIPDLVGSNPATRLESYLGRLYFEINHNPLAASVRAYFEAIELYASEITVTTNWMMGRSGLIKKMIQTELRAGRQVSIVSFNIDLLVENALCLLTHGRPRSNWSLNGAYGFSEPLPILVGSGGRIWRSISRRRATCRNPSVQDAWIHQLGLQASRSLSPRGSRHQGAGALPP